MWSTWLIVLCFMKMFQALARDRLDRLNASPSATPWMYFRVFSALLLVLSVDILWIRLCMMVYKALNTTMFLLLFFEPLSIAFETLQGIMVYGVQLLEMCHRQSVESKPDCKGSKLFDKSAAGFLSEMKGILIRNFGFFLDLMTLLMALGHYLLIWWLHGMAFHLIDAVLFLNLRALVATIVKRIRGYVKLKKALSLLDGVLPDATHEELHAYDDECAICREPMSRAKRLCCNHLFHLACLRSWLDQGLNGVYSCPTCRRPLFPSSQREQVNSGASEIVNDGQLGMQRRPGLDLHTMAANAVPEGVFPGQQGNPSDPSTWRGVGFDASLVPPWSNPAGDGAGPSNGMRPAGVGRLQMMMRHLASVSENYAHNTLEDTSWNLWPAWHGQPSSAPVRQRQDLNPGGVRFRSTSPSTNENLAGLLAMADTVREVLPHIPDDLIFQDLRRTNNVAVTVNNLLQLR
ncbi:E3 ubiquitin protein ligase RIN2 [Acorus calamus]|uniref:E3 ubiquitin protein ligase RIN2 n=1 Tax=Acorus calamus TaxID=4465 RepID=A0AAV9E277_ACOCL|nr:E3 ubiquitin protein ligase RIN2 [Acorus calamus]